MSTSVPLTEPRFGGGPKAPRQSRPAQRRPLLRRWWPWVVLGACIVSALFVVISGMRPSYDGFGFLVWGRQVLHWNLNTDGAPSWKPLPFLFTLPYAVAGRGQLWLWMGTAVAGAVFGSVFAARVAFRLTGASPDRRYAPYVAGAFAGTGVLGINTYMHLVLIANSDPLIVAVLLAAIDCHLCRRYRLAFGMLVLASLGRPEAWVFAGLYGLWLMWEVRTVSICLMVITGLVFIPACWFSIPALTSKSWFISGDLALNQQTVIHGNKIIGVINRFRSLYELPMQLAMLIGVVLAALRRDRATLLVVGAAATWLLIEVAFAYHGWSAVSRYMIEPAAVMVAVAGGGIGWLLADTRTSKVLRWLGPVVALGLIVALAPDARSRVRTVRGLIEDSRHSAKQIDRLHKVIDDDGGPDAIKACGQPVSLLGFQSTVAWFVNLNVGNVGFRPGKSIGRGDQIVLFKPHDNGWQVRLYNLPAPVKGKCDRLKVDSDFG
ncbi:MAG TPA: hypothetical protein VHV28_01645 [Solirubrobacteraceae bacterium]|nr:hypothetical protein [Solirubrobacteraceae bacterium]